ncbi:MAG: hypothetical protein MJH10_19890 [Epibacterium sp.]|nr:hypothetical protein [Epibacterium sp.]NQX75742.1 hypothetical protein [Epibacterium sp.]
MIKATKNFAYSGKTYFVGDEVPPHVAKAVDDSFTGQLEAKTKKPTRTKTLKGE